MAAWGRHCVRFAHACGVPGGSRTRLRPASLVCGRFLVWRAALVEELLAPLSCVGFGGVEACELVGEVGEGE